MGVENIEDFLFLLSLEAASERFNVLVGQEIVQRCSVIKTKQFFFF